MKHKAKITALAAAAIIAMPNGMAQMAENQPQPVKAVRVEIVKNSDIQQPIDAKRQRRYEIMILLQAYTIVPEEQKDAIKEEIIKRIRADYDENLEHTKQVVEKLEQKLNTLKASINKENVDQRIEQEFERLVDFTESSSIRLIPIESENLPKIPENNNRQPVVVPDVNFVPVGMAPVHHQPRHYYNCNSNRTRMVPHPNINRTGERPAIRPVKQHHEYIPRTKRVNRDRVDIAPAPRIPEADMMQPPPEPPAPPEEIKTVDPQPPAPPENVKPAEPLTPAQPAQSETVEAQPPAPAENQVQPSAAE